MASLVSTQGASRFTEVSDAFPCPLLLLEVVFGLQAELRWISAGGGVRHFSGGSGGGRELVTATFPSLLNFPSSLRWKILIPVKSMTKP